MELVLRELVSSNVQAVLQCVLQRVSDKHLILVDTLEKMLHSLCYWLGISHSDQTSHCHMQVLIPNNLA